jgi:hypothetical protein
LRYFKPLIPLSCIPKTIAADNDPRMQYDSVANATAVVDDDIRMKHAIPANRDVLTQKNTWLN